MVVDKPDGLISLARGPCSKETSSGNRISRPGAPYASNEFGRKGEPAGRRYGHKCQEGRFATLEPRRIISNVGRTRATIATTLEVRKTISNVGSIAATASGEVESSDMEGPSRQSGGSLGRTAIIGAKYSIGGWRPEGRSTRPERHCARQQRSGRQLGVPTE